MKRQLLVLALALGLATSANLPDITTYAKVTKNGEETNNTQGGFGGPLTWLINTLSTSNKTKAEVSEGRSGSDVSITVSPVYVPPRIPQLHKGEAVDYPTTKRYSTLDEEMLARLDSQAGRNRAQDRFHPPAIFEHDIAHGNAMRTKPMAGSSSSSSSSSSSGPSGSASQDSGASSNSASTGPGYSSPIFPGSYDYKPPSYLDVKPMTMSMDSYSPPDTMPKAPSSYDSPSIPYGPPADYPDHDHDHDQDHDHDHDHHSSDPELSSEIHSSDFGSGPIYGGSVPPKPVEYAGHYDHPAFADDPYIHDHDHGHDFHHDIIYDHIPDDHTTPEPEMMDQRLNKRPYSYYFVGKKLWYVPLYFSIYFIIYIAALILKSIARHKINFPHALASAVQSRSNDSPGWLDLTVKVLEGIETAGKRFAQKA